MGFHNVELPSSYSYGAQIGPRFNTAIIEMGTGHEERIPRWETPRIEMNIGYSIKEVEDLEALKAFYINRRGPAFGFLIKDWFDYTSASDGHSTPTPNDQYLGTGDGVVTTFQIIKKYSDGTFDFSRTIKHIVTASVRVAFDGVEQTSGWSVNTSTGVITFTSAPALGVVITVGFEYRLPVRFDSDVFALSYDSFRTGTVPEIRLVELIDENAYDEEANPGGASAYTIAANHSVDLMDGRAQHVLSLIHI